jgi:histidine triad (HIT) family protein
MVIQLLLQKNHFQDIYTVPDDILEVLLVTAKRIANHYKTQIGALGINILHASGETAQQSVPHIHFLLLPRFENDGLNAWPKLPVMEYNKDELLEKIKLTD